MSFAGIPFEHDVVTRAKTKRIAGVYFRVADAANIVVMKALALGPRDIADIEGILRAIPNLDLARARRDLKALSESLEEGPDFLSELNRLVAHHRRAPRAATRRRQRPS